MTEKLIESLMVSREHVLDEHHRGRYTNVVRLHGAASWLKNRPMISAKLTPAEARSLAKHLLVVADEVDGTR